MKKIIFFMLIIFSILLYSFEPPEWSNDLSIYEVNIRQYSPEGTFKAFQEHLPRLADMGCGILWLMPVNPIGEKNRKGTLGSYYSVSDYYGVNPEFGSEEDFQTLVNEIHDLGMYVIIDWVANHSSWDNVWTQTNPEFYKKDANGNFYPPVKDWADVIQLDYGNKELYAQMTEAMKFWVEKYDIDGFRCDVAEMVPLDFWKYAREEIEKVKPVFMLAECENPRYHEAFDMTYAWSAFGLFKDLSFSRKSILELDSYRMREIRKFDFKDYRMLFLSNHDENSWSESMVDHFPHNYKAFTVLSYALPGMPLTYSGQEALNPRELAFFDKDEINWQDTDMQQLYRDLNALKNENQCLHNGKWGGRIVKVHNSNPESIYSFYRIASRNKLLFVFNLSNTKKKFILDIDPGEYISCYDSLKYDSLADKELELEAWDYKILIYDD